MLVLPTYILQEKLSSNLHVDIYRGLSQQDDNKVILKISRNKNVSHEEFSALQHEFFLLKQLDVPGIIKAYKIVHAAKHTYLVLENLEGVALKNYLFSHPLNLKEFFDLALQMLNIVGALHQRQIIHKNIHPAAFLITPDRKLTLFDLSASSQLIEEIPEYTHMSQIQTSAHYISPEQTGRMNRPIDFRTDFYSLGVTFFEMLTSELPFHADDPLELVHLHIAKVVPKITKIQSEDLPPIVGDIIAKLLEKMPEDRYASMIGLKTDLLKCAEQWQQHHSIDNFILAEKDIHDHLNISHQLYGRQVQVKQLLSAFEKVSGGATQLMLIAGYSGVGKTSLVNEVHKPIVQYKGYFIQGKFDQLQRGKPYSAIVNAFQGLVKQILAMRANILSEIKQTLTTALGDSAQVIIDVIPEVELVIGKQPPVPVLNLAESQRRFNIIFQKFIRVFAHNDHPLVIFLDDLQWADTASLKFIENLLMDQETHYLLMLGAYRDNEVDSAHPLIATIRQLEKINVNIETLTLQPLQTNDVEQLLVDTLNSSTIKVKPLMSCIYEKTQGNPFFIIEFLKIIYQQQLLSFSYEISQWYWDLEKIKNQSMMDNVIDLLTTKIELLPTATRELLKLAACIGHQFDLKTLTIISNQDTYLVAQQLWAAIQANLIVPLEESNKTVALIESKKLNSDQKNLHYRFAHDRIQQTAYQLIPEKIQSEAHLQIGRLLLKEQRLLRQSERLFEIMDHFNQSLSLLNDKTEKHELAQYNLWAGIKAKESAAYVAAKNYLQAGITLLNPIKWTEDYELVFPLHKELAACKYLTSEFSQAEIEFKTLLENAKNVLDKIEIYQLNIQMLSTLNKHPEAINLGREALRLININIPKKANTLHILLVILKIKMQMKWQNTSKVKLLPMKNPTHRAAVDLVTQLLNNAFISDQTLFVFLAATDVNLSLKYGYTESTSMAILVYAFALIHALNLYTEGFSFVELYSQLKKIYSEANFAGRNHLVLGTFIDPYRLPLDDCLQTLTNGQQIANDVGDIVYSNYCNVVGCITIFLLGKPLVEVKDFIANSLIYIDRAKINDFKLVTYFWQHSIQILEGSTPFNLNRLTAQEKNIVAAENKTGISFFYSTYTKISYILGYYSEAQNSALKHKVYSEFALGILSNFENDFYYALSIAVTYKNSPSSKHNLAKFKKLYNYIKRCAAQYPFNFQVYVLLLDAELARINNNIHDAIALYEKSITTAQKQNILHLVAIANECAGRFYNELKIPQFAKQYFLNAYTTYRSWGALAKCSQLEQLFPEWFANYNTIENPIYLSTPVTTTKVSTQTLDMLAILKFTQAISSEIYIDKLLQKLLSLVLEAAAAQRCIILLLQDNHWVIEAEGDLEQQQIYLAQQETINNYKNLPLSLVNYVERTLEPVIIEEAVNSEMTLTDPYVQKYKPQSLLMMPLLYQGQLRRIIYLENKSTSQIFTTQHLQSLQLLASQAVVALENAYLYYQASHDPLTGLANRSLLYHMFQYYAGYIGRENKQIAILFLDLDYFKVVNDTLGHEVGDSLICYLGDLFKNILREGDVIARLGGDEFVIMLTGIIDLAEVTSAADRIYSQLAKPINLLGHEFWITSSLGISLYPTDGTDIQTLIKRADIALYRAKETGRNQYRFYSPELEAQHQEAHAAEREIQNAFERNEFILYYQPMFNSKTNQLSGMEALIRWQHPSKGLLEAITFIELLEKSLLMDSIGKWVLRTACQQAKSWVEQGLLTVPIAINVSVSQFKKQSISRLVASTLKEVGLDPNYLELELTETAFMENDEKILKESHELQALGVHLVLDDFGTGYSNLSYLKRIQVNKIKIDRSFVEDSQSNANSKAIIRALIAMAHSLNLTVVAEGVESEEQLNYLREQQIDYIQGYYLSYPLTSEDFEKWLRKKAK